MSRQSGFTLIELLIAIVIFALISAAAYKMLTSTANIKKIVQTESQILNNNIESEIIIEKDFLQVAGGYNNISNKSTVAFIANDFSKYKIKFIRSGRQHTLFDDDNKSDLLVIAYAVENKQLVRYSWFYDTYNEQQKPKNRLVLWDNISNFNLRFLDNKGKWHKTWEAKKNTANIKALTSNNVSKTENHDVIPKAVEIKFILEDNNPIVMTIPLPECLNMQDLKSLKNPQSTNLNSLFLGKDR